MILTLLCMDHLSRSTTRYVHYLLWVLPMLTVFSGKMTIPLLAVLLFCLLIAQRPLLVQRHFWRDLFLSRSAQITALLLAWPLLMLWHSFTPLRSFTNGLNTALLMYLGALTVKLALHSTTIFSPRFALFSLVGAMIVPSLIVLAELLPGGGLVALYYGGQNAAYTVFMEKDINRSMVLLVMFLWPAMYGLWRLGYRWPAMLLGLFCGPVVMLMQSSSAQLSWLLSFMLLFGVRLMPRVLPPLLSVALILVLIAWPAGFSTLEQKVGPGTEIYEQLKLSNKHRMAIWHFSLDHIAQKPWLGWGLDTARAIPGGSEEFAPGLQMLPLHTHNNVLQILLEEGIIGFVITLSGVMLLLRDWIRVCRADAIQGAGVGAIFFSFMIIGFTAFGVWQGWWIIAGWLSWLFFSYLHAQTKPVSL